MGRVVQIDNTVSSTDFAAATNTAAAETASLNLYNKVESYLSKVLVEYSVARDTENPFIVTINQLKTLVEDAQMAASIWMKKIIQKLWLNLAKS
jgi:hypothetical protein